MKIGDYVTRKKYNHDLIFQVIQIEKDKVYLRGKMVRLIADAPIDDLQTYQPATDEKEFEVMVPHDSDMIKGKILHVDGDKTYLRKCMDFYKENMTPVVGVYLQEDKMKDNIIPLLKKHRPDILIITGHDSFSFKREQLQDHEGYKNSHYFIETVKQARLYQPNKDALIIIAGACQSNYEGLIKSGANFASSPTKINIHALDPACIAISIANTHVNQYVEVEKILKDTISKGKGIGGIDSKGVARKIYSTK